MTLAITCPHCGGTCGVHVREDACTYFHACECCGRVVRAAAGDCCVVCSYGRQVCPPRRDAGT